MFLSEKWVVMGQRKVSAVSLSEAGSQARPVPQHPSSPLPPASPSFLSDSAPDTLQAIRKDLEGCRRCRLFEQRTHVVFGEGDPNSRLVIVGEAPGAEEDLQGRPFVGRAGQLLTKMLEAIQLRRDQVYIANVIKSRPPQNRPPEPDEIQACAPFLKRQLRVLKPQVILAMGRVSVQFFFQSQERISSLRGQHRPYACTPEHQATVVATFHPAYLLRNPSAKKEAWQDLQQVAQLLGIALPSRPGVTPSMPTGAKP